MVGVRQNHTKLLDEATRISSDTYQSLRLIKEEPDWNDKVEHVVVLLSASRSGSSLIFQALSSAKNVISPAGEHEPWLFLSNNKFPFTESDYLASVNKKDILLRLLRNDLLVRQDVIDTREYIDLLGNRLSIRGDNSGKDTFNRIELGETISAQEAMRLLSTLEDQQNIGQRYWPIENPPYISQPLARHATLKELSLSTLLFKSPSDAYRPGFYEALFPSAQITYIHLSRGFVQTVNGLMDGWSKSEIDFISNPLGFAGKQLAIKDYSKSYMTSNYWCFDLFPGWENYTNTSLLEVCSQQWLHANKSILENFPVASQIKFENFYTNRDSFLAELESSTNISVHGFDWDQTVMSTDKPQQFRWKKRAGIFQHLDDYLGPTTLEKVISIQEKLGYSMEEASWH